MAFLLCLPLLADIQTQLLPHLRRIVTSHNAHGKSIVLSNTEMPSETMQLVEGGRAAALWVTTDSIPTDENNKEEDGGKRDIDNLTNFHLVHPTGTNLRTTELAPGAITPMHRTTSLDYNILVEGELLLITEDGTETHLKTPGDTVIQKGSMHAWKNPSSSWTRWISVLVAAEPVVFNGKPLAPEVVSEATGAEEV